MEALLSGGNVDEIDRKRDQRAAGGRDGGVLK